MTRETFQTIFFFSVAHCSLFHNVYCCKSQNFRRNLTFHVCQRFLARLTTFVVMSYGAYLVPEHASRRKRRQRCHISHSLSATFYKISPNVTELRCSVRDYIVPLSIQEKKGLRCRWKIARMCSARLTQFLLVHPLSVFAKLTAAIVMENHPRSTTLFI